MFASGGEGVRLRLPFPYPEDGAALNSSNKAERLNVCLYSSKLLDENGDLATSYANAAKCAITNADRTDNLFRPWELTT